MQQRNVIINTHTNANANYDGGSANYNKLS